MSAWRPAGLGMWIAFLERVGGHAKAIEALHAVGARWVCIRGADGGDRLPSWSPDLARAALRAYHDAGIAVVVWIFSKPWTWRQEVQLFRAFRDEGADGCVIDAESLWDVGQVDVAERYMDALRAPTGVGEQTFVADAPWPWPLGHPSFPFAAFARGVDVRMPQAYAEEIGTNVPNCLARMQHEWAAVEASMGAALVRPRYPIMDTYSHVTKITPAEMAAFLDAYADDPDAPISLYSLEAMLRPPFEGVDPGVYAYLRARAAAATSTGPTIVPPPDPAPLQTEVEDEEDAGEGAEIPPEDPDRSA